MMKNRVFAGVLALTMALIPFTPNLHTIKTNMTIAASAEENMPAVWNGSADTSWYYTFLYCKKCKNMI